jgi:hypothetical protein
MLVKERKSWYQKGPVQAAFVAGGFGVALLWLRPNDAPVVIIQEQPNSLSVPAVSRSEPAESPAEDQLIEVEPRRKSSVPVRRADAAPAPERPASKEISDLDQPRSLSPDTPRTFPSLSTAITASFRETLGSRYVEIVVAAPDGAPDRFPVRSAGASRRFSARGSLYEVQVVAIDWNRSRVDVIVRAVSGS